MRWQANIGSGIQGSREPRLERGNQGLAQCNVAVSDRAMRFGAQASEISGELAKARVRSSRDGGINRQELIAGLLEYNAPRVLGAGSLAGTVVGDCCSGRHEFVVAAAVLVVPTDSLARNLDLFGRSLTWLICNRGSRNLDLVGRSVTWLIHDRGWFKHTVDATTGTCDRKQPRTCLGLDNATDYSGYSIDRCKRDACRSILLFLCVVSRETRRHWTRMTDHSSSNKRKRTHAGSDSDDDHSRAPPPASFARAVKRPRLSSRQLECEDTAAADASSSSVVVVSDRLDELKRPTFPTPRALTAAFRTDGPMQVVGVLAMPQSLASLGSGLESSVRLALLDCIASVYERAQFIQGSSDVQPHRIVDPVAFATVLAQVKQVRAVAARGSVCACVIQIHLALGVRGPPRLGP